MTSSLSIQSKDGATFDVERSIICQSVTVKNICGDLGITDNSMPIPLPFLDSKMLKKVVEYCKYAKGKTDALITQYKEKKLGTFEEAFFEEPEEYILDILMAANYLAIDTLIEAACLVIAHKMKDNTTEEIRAKWKIEDDFEEGEEETLRRQEIFNE